MNLVLWKSSRAFGLSKSIFVSNSRQNDSILSKSRADVISVLILDESESLTLSINSLKGKA